MVKAFAEQADNLDYAYGFYLNNQWDLLDATMRKNFESTWPKSPSELDRHTCIHRLLYLGVVPLDPVGRNPTAKHEVWSRIFKKEEEFSQAAYWTMRDPRFIVMHKRIANQFIGLLRSHVEWIPALPMIYLRANGISIPESWRIPVGNIESLRDAYRQNFELSCQALHLVVRMQNISEGRSHEAIRNSGSPAGWAPRSLRTRDHVNNMNQFIKTNAATKEAYLNRTPALRHFWEAAFDRDVRNSIAHADFDYLAHAGVVTFKDGEIPYYVFVEALIRQVSLLFFWLDLCKLYKIYGSRWDEKNQKFLGLGA
jgi:hypothetical protein